MSAQTFLKVLNIHRQNATSERNSGVICFISNGVCLNGNITDGCFRALEQEFDSIYVFSLQGSQRTSGELSSNEGGKVFGPRSCTPIAIAISAKKPK